MPNNKIPEENADDMIIFIAASDDCLFSKSKLASAANGIVDTSDVWLIDGHRVNAGKPFTACGTEWIAEAVTNEWRAKPWT